MTWLKVDERFTSSPLAVRSPRAAMLYLDWASYLLRYNLDAIPAVIVEHHERYGMNQKQMAECLSLLEKYGAASRQEDGTYLVHHYWIEDSVVLEDPSSFGDAEMVARARARLPMECAHCGTTEAPLEVDHIVPRARGGYSRPNNLQRLCKPCNIRKGSRIPWGHLNQRGAE